MNTQAVRWNVKVSRETDSALRRLLAAQGRKKGGMSKFIEEAVRWRVFHRTVQDIKARNAGMRSDEVQRLVDDAVRDVRAHRRSHAKATKL